MISLSGVAQKRLGSPLSLIPLKVSSSCHHVRMFVLATVRYVLLITDLHPDVYKAAL